MKFGLILPVFWILHGQADADAAMPVDPDDVAVRMLALHNIL